MKLLTTARRALFARSTSAVLASFQRTVDDLHAVADKHDARRRDLEDQRTAARNELTARHDELDAQIERLRSEKTQATMEWDERDTDLAIEAGIAFDEQIEASERAAHLQDIIGYRVEPIGVTSENV